MSRRPIQHNSIHLNSIHLLMMNMKEQNWSTVWKRVLPTFGVLQFNSSRKDQFPAYSLWLHCSCISGMLL